MTTQGSRQLKPLKRSDGNYRPNVTCLRNSSTSLSSHACSIAVYEESLRLWKPYGFGSGSLEIAVQLVSALTPSSLWPLAFRGRTIRGIKGERSHETSSGLSRADPALRGLPRAQEGRPLARRRGDHGAIEPPASGYARLGPITEIMVRTEIRTFDRRPAVDRRV
jgi:hypothetical protein